MTDERNALLPGRPAGALIGRRIAFVVLIIIGVAGILYGLALDEPEAIYRISSQI